MQQTVLSNIMRLSLIVLTLLGMLDWNCSALSAATSKHILFDVPVSNNGARCRIITYKVQYGKGE